MTRPFWEHQTSESEASSFAWSAERPPPHAELSYVVWPATEVEAIVDTRRMPARCALSQILSVAALLPWSK